MPVPNLISRWRSQPEVGANVIDWRYLEPRPAQTQPLPAGLPAGLLDALLRSGIQSLYTHQAAAWQQAQAGKSMVVVTGTASGKTICYNLPVVASLLQDPQARALYIFPTKALAQDQLAVVGSLWQAAGGEDPSKPGPAIAVYDGDTPASARPGIRSSARLLITNPDMLHTGILPHHTNWAEFFRNLRFIVIDEIHIYRGVFGSHVANVMRRLKRVARFYGAAPQFVLTSATIANPVQLAGWLAETPVELIDQDGSPRGGKYFLIYNPPVVNRELGLRRSVLQETVRLAEDLLTYKAQTIIFGRTRRSVEVMLTYLREQTNEVVRGYRSGYLPRQRREIEQGLRSGQVRAVVATTALELGIDIGGMEAALLAGYPGTIAGTWQQAGRAGRKNELSLAVLITSADPLDQFLAKHPEYFFARSPEQALLNPDNLLILLGHLRCAAFELPFQAGEDFGSLDTAQLQEFLAFLCDQGVLHLSGSKYFWMSDAYPAEGVSLRSASPDNVVLQARLNDGWTTVGQVDIPSAPWMVHPGAVYLHEAQTYLVEELDLEQNLARLKAAQVDYYTQPVSETNVTLVEETNRTAVKAGEKAFGDISVTTRVTGYRKVRWHTHENLGLGVLDLPPSNLQTTGYWISLSEQTVSDLADRGLWTNAPIQYGPNWHGQRERARQRDGYRCQVCGTLETGRQHDVHHKTPFRTLPSYELANQLANLITLCHPCHRKIEMAVRIRSGLAGLGFALGHIAPLFLMCDSRDLGVHTDPQAALTGGQPTVVVYDLVPSGIGFAPRLFDLHNELMHTAHELVRTCECSDGCPSCVGPGGENGLGGKKETLAILEALTA